MDGDVERLLLDSGLERPNEATYVSSDMRDPFWRSRVRKVVDSRLRRARIADVKDLRAGKVVVRREISLP